MKDLELTLTVRNNQLKSRRLAAGLTLQKLSELCGVPHNELCSYETMRVHPRRTVRSYDCVAPGCEASGGGPGLCRDHTNTPKTEVKSWRDARAKEAKSNTGDWREPVKKLAAFWKCTEEDLFPEEVQKAKQTKFVREVDASEVPGLFLENHEAMALPPEEKMMQLERSEALENAVAALPDRHQLVIRSRFFDGKSLDETAQITPRVADDGLDGVTRETVRQIEATALRMLAGSAISRAHVAHPLREEIARRIERLRAASER